MKNTITLVSIKVDKFLTEFKVKINSSNNTNLQFFLIILNIKIYKMIIKTSRIARVIRYYCILDQIFSKLEKHPLKEYIENTSLTLIESSLG